MFCIYNRESSNRMEFKPRIYIYIYIISRKILEEKRCFICANLIFTEVGGIRERRGKENIKMPRRRSTISRRLVFVACARAATLLAFYAWDTDTRIIINCLRTGQSEFSLSSLSIFLWISIFSFFLKHTFSKIRFDGWSSQFVAKILIASNSFVFRGIKILDSDRLVKFFCTTYSCLQLFLPENFRYRINS